MGVPFHRRTGGRRLRRLRQGASLRHGWRRRHGDTRRHLRFCAGGGTRERAASNRSSRRRAIRLHRADEHGDWRFRSPGLASRQVAARRRRGVEEGRAQFRPRCKLSVSLREGHAAHAIQQGDLCSSRLRDLFASPAGGQGAGQIERRDHQRYRAGSVRRLSAPLPQRACRAAR